MRAELERFSKQQKIERHKKADEHIAALVREAKQLPKGRR
jgi:hypothetical protein